MPFYRRRRPYKRRRAPVKRRRYRKARILRKPKANTLLTRQKVLETQIVPASALPDDFIPHVQFFTLNQIDPTQLASIQRLFTQYRIKGVKMTWMNKSSGTAATPGTTALCDLYSAPTQNPYADPGDWITLSQGPLSNARVRSKTIGRYNLTNPKAVCKTKPKALYLTNNPGSPVAGLVAAPANKWFNCIQNAGTPHAGIRYAYYYQLPHVEQEYSVMTEFILEFRNVV